MPSAAALSQNRGSERWGGSWQALWSSSGGEACHLYRANHPSFRETLPSGVVSWDGSLDLDIVVPEHRVPGKGGTIGAAEPRSPERFLRKVEEALTLHRAGVGVFPLDTFVTGGPRIGSHEAAAVHEVHEPPDFIPLLVVAGIAEDRGEIEGPARYGAAAEPVEGSHHGIQEMRLQGLVPPKGALGRVAPARIEKLGAKGLLLVYHVYVGHEGKGDEGDGASARSRRSQVLPYGEGLARAAP